jgi:hypothetical protein
MATVNKLLRELAALENETKEGVAADPIACAGIRAGFAIAEIVAAHTLLELGIKGVLPEGKGGRIIEEVKKALRASANRIAPRQ